VTLKNLKRRAWLLALLGCALAMPRVASAQAGCSGTPCNNPVPCYACGGSWNDGTGVTWNVSMNSFSSISGSATLTGPPGCQNVTYSVSGSVSPSRFGDGIQGYTSFTWTASSPSPSGSCNGYTPVPSITNQGFIQNSGCDKGTGQWSDASGHGNFTMTKTPDIPSGEITNPVGFSSYY
jgi:hypothetical protein